MDVNVRTHCTKTKFKILSFTVELVGFFGNPSNTVFCVISLRAETMVVQSSRSLALAGVLSSLLRPVASFSTAKTSCLDDLTWFPKLESPQPSSSFLEVYNPADASQIVARLKVATRSDVRKSIELSEAVLPKWRDGTTASYRSSLLTKWSNLIQQHRLDIAKIMTLESGKPLGESLGEVNYGTSFLDYYASEALRPSGSILPTTFSTADGITPRGRSLALTQAVGVTGLITPWNFPIAMITRKVGPALAAGCTSLVKPSELTPLTAILIQELAEQAGIPKGVLQTM
jgi:acyl-CoA reductase-like NAD-dependent aldehyde dehydrogenase